MLALLIYVYALAGTQIRFSTQQERRLEESIAAAIFEDLEMLKKNSLTNTKSVYQRNLLLLGMYVRYTHRDAFHFKIDV